MSGLDKAGPRGSEGARERAGPGEGVCGEPAGGQQAAGGAASVECRWARNMESRRHSSTSRTSSYRSHLLQVMHCNTV